MDTNRFKLISLDSPEISNIDKQWQENSSSLVFEQTPTWYQTLFRYIKEKNDKGRIALQYDTAGNLILILPIILQKRFFINSIAPIANYYTSLFEVIELNNHANTIENGYTTLLNNLLSNKKWDQFTIGPMDKESHAYRSIIDACKKLDISFVTYYRFDNYTLDLKEKKFTDYYDQLPTRLKNTIKRKQKKIRAKYHDYEIEIVKTSDGVKEALDAFEFIYNKSWKKKEGKPEFIREFSIDAAKTGWLRIGILRLNGEPCAAQIWFVKDGVASIFKLAHHEEYRGYSVGTLLFYELIREVLSADAITKIDFLIGGDSYKKDWGFIGKERWGIQLLNRNTITGKGLYLRHGILPRILKPIKNRFN